MGFGASMSVLFSPFGYKFETFAAVFRGTQGANPWNRVAYPLLQNRSVKTPRHILICVLWLLAAGAGAWGLMRYENTPTSSGETPSRWPAESRIERLAGHSSLVMFVHPHCPCSHASVAELNRLLSHCQGPATVHVLFIRPKGVSDDWTETSLRKSAEAIPGVKVELDPEGREAQRFGAESSGYVVLYSPDGQLLFSGGITGSRGHEGDNAGENLVIAGLNGQAVSLEHTPVFGCSLQGECDVTSK